jgi:hypothetical protein
LEEKINEWIYYSFNNYHVLYDRRIIQTNIKE